MRKPPTKALLTSGCSLAASGMEPIPVLDRVSELKIEQLAHVPARMSRKVLAKLFCLDNYGVDKV